MSSCSPKTHSSSSIQWNYRWEVTAWYGFNLHSHTHMPPIPTYVDKNDVLLLGWGIYEIAVSSALSLFPPSSGQVEMLRLGDGRAIKQKQAGSLKHRETALSDGSTVCRSPLLRWDFGLLQQLVLP